MVQVTQQAVRVYGSTAYMHDNLSDDSQTRLVTLDPYLLDDKGTRGRILIYLGAPMAWVKDASSIRQAIGHVILSMLAGVQLSPDPEHRITEALQSINTAQKWQDSWYITIVLEQEISVPDEAIIAKEYIWLDGDIPVYELAQAFQQIASPHLDRLATLASTIISSDAFQKVVVADHVFFSTPGRRTFGWPETRGRFHAHVSRSLDSLDISALETRLRRSTLLSRDAFEWLSLVTPWWLAGLRDQDSWRAFAQLFTGLELLHSRLVKRYYPRVAGSGRVTGSDLASRKATPILAALFNDKNWKAVKSRDRLYQRGEFAVLALALFPYQADADFNTFEMIRQVRNEVAHGEQTIDGAAFPLLPLRELFGRYLDAAIQEHLSSSVTTH